MLEGINTCTDRHAPHREEVYGRGINVNHRRQVNDDEVDSLVVGTCTLERLGLMAGQCITHRVDICKVEGGVNAQQQHAINELSLWILLDVPAGFIDRQ